MHIDKQERTVTDYTLTLSYPEVHNLYHFLLEIAQDGTLPSGSDERRLYEVLREWA